VSEVITIDGPVSSGKNSVALLFSQRIGYQLIDSGSIYRAFAIAILRHGISVDDDLGIENVLNNIRLEYLDEGDEQKVLLDGEDVTEDLHNPGITSVVPFISAKKFVREIANGFQKKLVEGKNTVMAGRDIGSEIFPDAPLKFFLTATPEVRAERRFKQLQEKDPRITYEEVLRQVKERDMADTTRDVSPLRKPDDAIVIDTTDLSTEDSVEEFMKYFNNRKV